MVTTPVRFLLSLVVALIIGTAIENILAADILRANAVRSSETPILTFVQQTIKAKGRVVRQTTRNSRIVNDRIEIASIFAGAPQLAIGGIDVADWTQPEMRIDIALVAPVSSKSSTDGGVLSACISDRQIPNI